MRVMGSYCPSFARTMDICSLVHTALPERQVPMAGRESGVPNVKARVLQRTLSPASLFLFIRLYITDDNYINPVFKQKT